MSEQRKTKPKTVNCPHCGALVPWNAESKFRPFCSERCKLIDLGQWAAEKYRVPTEGGGAGHPEPNGDA